MDKNITDISGFAVDRATLNCPNGAVITVPDSIAEYARLDHRVFIVFDAKQSSISNLWAFDLNGVLLWKAPDLNSKGTPPWRTPKRYSMLTIFDEAAPKLRMYVDDKSMPIIDPATGLFLHLLPDVTAKNYSAVWPQFQATTALIQAQIFVRSTRLLTVGAEKETSYPLPA